ncbi:MAG: hypothetical protein FWC61_01185 [Proteobacteria bacterium]|nr:hypothetical protein [Pseudomonadota bacterium]
MFVKFLSRKYVREIMDDDHMNRAAQKFIKKYLYECARRDKKLKQQTKELENLKKQKPEPKKIKLFLSVRPFPPMPE